MNIQQSKITNINLLHRKIGENLKDTVKYAVSIGEALSEIKENIGHGNFLGWMGDNCNFGQRTAWRYMKCYEYKLATLANLQEAYKQIEDIEKQKKREEWNRKDNLIKERVRTGEKPDNWDRSCDYEYKKRTDKIAFDKRKAEAFKQKETPIIDSTESIDATLNMAYAHIDDMKRQQEEKQQFKEKVRLSGDNAQNPFFEYIDEYLLALNSDNLRIEACHNIIKYCRGIANGLQGKNK